MKRAILFLVLFAVATVCMAQMTSVQAYLDDPGRETFRVAVDSLTQAIQSGENPSQTKLYLMYILDNEVSLLKEDLLAGADSLDTGGRFSLGNVLLGMRDYTAAIKIYAGLNKDYPNWSCPWRHKGQALYEMKDYTEAERALFQAISTNEEHYDAYIWLAKTQKELGKYPQALENLEKARKLNPNWEESEDNVFTQAEIDELTAELRSKL
ncbi:MAG TPA: tetratricopeptide repeat protein [Candidatus Cloacimonadota bacterium]|nr:tetratricopeptide repeat protein [Candidatus Cloacimonadota bacterium]